MISLTGILFVAANIFFFKQAVPKRDLPVLGQITDFQLTDSDEQVFDSKSLSGKVWVADFIFTTCASVCPIMSRHMASLHRSYLLEPDTAFVSISVNPENDTPDVLNEYAGRYSADTKHWHFLTGPRERIKDIAVNSFKVGSAEEPVFHSTYMILVDGSGAIRGYYEGTQKSDIQKLFKDIAVLLRRQNS